MGIERRAQVPVFLAQPCILGAKARELDAELADLGGWLLHCCVHKHRFAPPSLARIRAPHHARRGELLTNARRGDDLADTRRIPDAAQRSPRITLREGRRRLGPMARRCPHWAGTLADAEEGTVFHKVVWATDGSDPADEALATLKTMMNGSDAEIVVVHCRELTMPGKGGGGFPVHANEHELQSKIERQTSELGDRAQLRMAQSMVGGAAHMIAEIADEEGADLIIAGTRGHTLLGGLLVGSVTQRLLHIAPCPVLVVPANHHTA
jgi:nucleotide-binding universal stress UspA family protein